MRIKLGNPWGDVETISGYIPFREGKNASGGSVGAWWQCEVDKVKR